MKHLISAIIFSIIFLSASHAEETYYTPDGQIISKQLYEILQKEREMKAERKTAERPEYEQTTAVLNPADKIPRDMFGRPLKDHKGRWITYPDEDTEYRRTYRRPNSTTTRTKSYRQQSSSMRKMIDAREADQAKEQFLESGKMTDLHKYREALKEYYQD